MKLRSIYATLASSTAILSAVCVTGLAPAAHAQDSAAEADSDDTIVVTGSRIRRSVAATPAPVVSVGEQTFDDRGYVSAADALNQITSIDPQLNQALGDGTDSGSGQQFPSLFGLGTGRTLTLVNGRRSVTTSSGLGDAQVDANIIPTGLIDRVEIVQAGGAAVYGSDAIAGVVNYVLKDNFEGIELDGLTGLSDRGDYWQKNLRLTAGTNFAGDRGNIAANVEWSSTPLLTFSDRPLSNLSRITQGNPADTGPNDGIPSVQEIIPAHFWNFNQNGVIFRAPAPPPMFLTGVQFDEDGSIIPYDPGTILGIPFAQGGDGFRYSDLAGLRTGVDRITGNIVGHYDLTDRITFSTELLYARTESENVPQGFARTVLNQTSPTSGAILFNRNNPFLTQSAIDSLIAISPGFEFGAPLWLSKEFYTDLYPDQTSEINTETMRALAALDGDFDAAGRNFYWSVSGSFARVEGGSRDWGTWNDRFNRAISAVSDGMGGAVCAVNADMDPSNDDQACAPLNPFGYNNASEAAREYVSVRTGEDYVNEQIDFLATIGTSLFTLPAGGVDMVLAYEHRDESAKFTPLPANQLGLTGTGAMQVPTSGGYNTDEISVEVLVPLFGGDATLPLVQELELSGTFRYVDNSIAGTESVWSAGGRWRIVDDLLLRATRSRNFRAPTLTQLFAPSNVTLTQSGVDPCDADRISSGPNPAVRLANCQAEWAANPAYGDLATFQNPAENFTFALIETGGNPDLRNEVSDTWTYGFVLEPRFIPGLTVSMDRVEIDLTDGLSAFTNADFMATCYDSSPQPADICSVFTRLAMDDIDAGLPAGTVISGRTTTFNAGVVKFRGEVYFVNYNVPLDAIFKSGDPGDLSLSLEVTHTSLLTTSVTGTTFTRSDNTAQQPDWVGRFDLAYATGPMRFTYQLYYLDKVLAAPNATIENNPNPVLDTNITHAISAQVDVLENVTLRAGVTNLTDKAPSYPNISYGDILGRRFFVGANVRF
jgi:outer membrane receptor protein involved in Fe transport